MNVRIMYRSGLTGLRRPVKEVLGWCEHRGHLVGILGLASRKCPNGPGVMTLCLGCELEWLARHDRGECDCYCDDLPR